MSCQECIQRCQPSDPRQPTLDPHFKRAHPYQYPRYHLPECDSCPDKPEEPSPKEKDAPWVANQWDTIKQLRAMTLFLQGKLNEHLDKSKVDKQTKYTISK